MRAKLVLHAFYVQVKNARMSDDTTPRRGSKGGAARAAKLTKSQLSASGAKAATARWAKEKGIPQAEFEGTITVAGIEIDCAVVEVDGKHIRLLSERSVTRALGGKRGGSHWLRLKEGGAALPVYLSAKNLAPFIDAELEQSLTAPVQYLTANGAYVANGIPAETLPKAFWVYQDAYEKDALLPSQAKIAAEARRLLRALSNLSLVALVDEATGFQEVRAKDALAHILETFIAKELQAWTRTFPLDFYKEIFRLNGWKFDPASVKRPGCIGTWTNDVVYERLAPGVLDELKKKNPKVGGRRKHKFFQWLTGEVGHPRLLAHLEGVKMLMKVSRDWDEFKERVDQFYPKVIVSELGFEVESTPAPKQKRITGQPSLRTSS
jgi:hypothetical protein